MTCSGRRRFAVRFEKTKHPLCDRLLDKLAIPHRYSALRLAKCCDDTPRLIEFTSAWREDPVDDGNVCWVNGGLAGETELLRKRRLTLTGGLWICY